MKQIKRALLFFRLFDYIITQERPKTNPKKQLDDLHSLPAHCCFVNYLRCHDDIGWGLNEEYGKSIGIEKGLDEQDAGQVELGIRRDLMMHAVIMCMGGHPQPIGAGSDPADGGGAAGVPVQLCRRSQILCPGRHGRPVYRPAHRRTGVLLSRGAGALPVPPVPARQAIPAFIKLMMRAASGQKFSRRTALPHGTNIQRDIEH